jgi:glyoxalase superfamily protein
VERARIELAAPKRLRPGVDSIEAPHRRYNHDDRVLESMICAMGFRTMQKCLKVSEHHGDGTPGTHVLIETEGVDALLAELKVKNYRYMNPGHSGARLGQA